MGRSSVWFFGLAVFAVTLGCGEKSKPLPQATKAVENIETVDAAPSREEVLADEPVETKIEVEAETTAKPERVIFLTPGGPLVADIFLSIAGHSHGKLLEEQIQRVLTAADTNDDGKPTWAEWKKNEKFFEEELPEAPSPNRRQMKQWIERYDQNFDKKMQATEAASWLGRGQGGSVRAFSVRSSRSYVTNLVSGSRVWQLLDRDNDERLSEDEIRHATDRFWQLDADDDRMITSSELATLEEQLQTAGGRSFRSKYVLNRYAAIHLDSTFEADRLDSLLSDFYAPRQNLRPSSFPDLPNLFATLDIDRNEWLDEDELSELFRIDPRVKVSISFHDSEDSRKPAKVCVEGLAEGVSLVAQNSDDRVVISLGTTRLIISAHDLTTVEGQDSALRRSQIRLMVHDQGDVLFREIDSNDDGRLGERELTSCGERMKKYDANGDGQLTIDEFPYSMVVAFLRGEEASKRGFYTPNTAVAKSHGEGTPLWFTQADFNADGDLSRREFLGSSDRFESLDLNRDGYVDAEEAVAYEAD